MVQAVISASMLIALLFAAAFTGGLVERLIGRNLTGLVGRRAVRSSDHVLVVGLGQVGLRLCLLLRETGIAVVAIDDKPDGVNVGQARRLGIPVVIGRGADPSLLRRLSIDRAQALAAVTADDLENIKVALSARAETRRPADRPARGLQRDGRGDPLARASRPRARRPPHRRRLPRGPGARLRRRPRRRRRRHRAPARAGRRDGAVPLSRRGVIARRR